MKLLANLSVLNPNIGVAFKILLVTAYLSLSSFLPLGGAWVEEPCLKPSPRMYLVKWSTLKFVLILFNNVYGKFKAQYNSIWDLLVYSLSSFQWNEKCYLDRIVLALSPRSYDIKTKNTNKKQERKGLYPVGAPPQLLHSALTVVCLKNLCLRFPHLLIRGSEARVRSSRNNLRFYWCLITSETIG